MPEDKPMTLARFFGGVALAAIMWTGFAFCTGVVARATYICGQAGWNFVAWVLGL